MAGMIKPNLFTISLLMTYLCGQTGVAIGEEKTATIPEQQLKAVYLVHLSEFTTWSAEKMQPAAFTICIDATSELVAPLNEVKASGRLVKEKSLVIQHELTAKNINNCHIFYVDARTVKLFTETRKQLMNASVLTVSSEVGFAENGGDVEYYLDDEKVRMKANLKSIENSKLVMSSKVLQLMKIVEGGN